MSVTCQIWESDYSPTTDSIQFKCKVWTPCKIGTLEEETVEYEALPGFIVTGQYSPKLDLVSPQKITINNVSKWPQYSKFYLMQDYGPFMFYHPDWELTTFAPAELYLNSWKRFKDPM